MMREAESKPGKFTMVNQLNVIYSPIKNAH